MRQVVLLVGVVGMIGCGGAAGTPASPQEPALVLPEALRAPRGALLFGDLHGTRELPAFVGRVVTALAEREPVVLCLEIPAAEAPAVPAYLASDGGAAARAHVLGDPFWRNEYQDGRRSVAMLELIDTARRLRAAGKRVDVELFDPAPPPDAAPDAREAGMAERVLAVRAARPDATLVVYAGNLHTMRAKFEPLPDEVWLGMRLAKAGMAFVTLGPRWAHGSAWICGGASASTCGAQRVHGKDGAPGIHLGATPGGQYDGWFDVGPVNASPPAAFPERALSEAELAVLRKPEATAKP